MKEKIKLSKSEILSRHSEEWTRHRDYVVFNGQGVHIETSRLGSKYIFIYAYTADEYETAMNIAVYDGYENLWHVNSNKYVTFTD